MRYLHKHCGAVAVHHTFTVVCNSEKSLCWVRHEGAVVGRVCIRLLGGGERHARRRAQVAAGCMVGAGTTMGDKCSVKRSVLGPMCVLGAGVKVINSVLMEGCAVGDGCHLQNSILCSGAHLQVCACLRATGLGKRHLDTQTLLLICWMMLSVRSQHHGSAKCSAGALHHFSVKTVCTCRSG